MSGQPRKLPWFQYHLSTAVILMFVAGGLMWANLQPRVEGSAECYDKFYGWPNVVYWTGTEHRLGTYTLTITDPRWPVPRGYIRTGPLVINVVTALAVLITAAFLCELLTCRPRPRVLPRRATVAMLVVAAGALAWANCREVVLWSTEGRLYGLETRIDTHRGWPAPCYYCVQKWAGRPPSKQTERAVGGCDYPRLTNLFVCACLLIALAVLSEILLRHRERQQ